MSSAEFELGLRLINQHKAIRGEPSQWAIYIGGVGKRNMSTGGWGGVNRDGLSCNRKGRCLTFRVNPGLELATELHSDEAKTRPNTLFARGSYM